MPELKNGMRLYHGSYCEVAEPDLSKCSRFKDFGQGFYLTSSREQAQSFAKISTSKAVGRDLIKPQRFGIVSTYVYEEGPELSIKNFPSAGVDWLHCVVGHRRNNYFLDVVRSLRDYDVISGKIANDNTNATIITYLDGLYGEIGSDSADSICIGLLLPERLKDQICFRTVKALNALKFEGSERVWL